MGENKKNQISAKIGDNFVKLSRFRTKSINFKNCMYFTLLNHNNFKIKNFRPLFENNSKIIISGCV